MVTLTQQQMVTILSDEYIESQIVKCESFLDDLDPEDDRSEFARIEGELDDWISLLANMQNEID